MSVINTSPRDRLPISTEICEFHPETIKKAILNEVERGGQVYFVHNRVQTIMSIYRYLTKLLPHIRIAVGHGQMPERELEDVMQEFYAHYYDVLLSTSIIESGLDIPRVNTIVINRADHFGLAQLYQLRGRVGRSDRPARSILLIPPLRVLTDTARKRLKALEQHTELGSGFYLAMKDLEIRGAGNLLGAQQHGFIEEVGFDLYLKLLKEAVDEIRGDKTEAQKSVKIDVDFELYFPNDYIAHPQQKVELYQKLAQVDNYEDLNDLKLEAIDRYGPLPTPAENLFGMTELRLLAHRSGIDRLVFKKGILKLIYAEDHLPTKKQVSNLSGKLSDPIEFSAVGEFTITVDLSDIPENNRVQKLKFVLQLLL
jgi:transcription-repair coupling factor (superfamily II helicase)